QGAFIGNVHRMASRLDGHFDFVAGALSSTPEKALASGQELGLAPERIYANFNTMAAQEAAREDGIEVVAIVTPNHMHFAPAEAFLRHGIHVICDKPMVTSLSEARRLSETVRQSGCVFVLTHNYSAYPMVRQARDMVLNGELGTVRVVQVEYPQGWLADRAERSGTKQAVWRTDPAQAGAGGAIGDIGTHAFHLAGFVTGLEVDSLAADLTSFVDGRVLDDNAHIMLRYKGGARGMIWCSQVAVGGENGLRLRVVCEGGSLDWEQENPNHLLLARKGEQTQRITRGGPMAGAAATAMTRLPAGHPEGYLEAFSGLYTEAATLIRAKQNGQSAPPGNLAPGVEDGVEGVAFIEACVRSAKQNSGWTRLER
ncbi:MAG: Gfo/Idh/MocA family oxidoreductase, partial [Pseudomonadota bacterium]